MMSTDPITCLLCKSLLPPDDKEVFISHVKEQHRVFSSMEFVMEASSLHMTELALVMEFMESVKKKRESKKCLNDDANEDAFKVIGTSHILKIDKETNDSSQIGQIKLESNEKLNHEIEEACSKPSQKRRGLKKGSTFLGKLDRKSKVILGNCKCPLCKEEFSITNFASERLYRTHLYSHGVRRFTCECE